MLGEHDAAEPEEEVAVMRRCWHALRLFDRGARWELRKWNFITAVLRHEGAAGRRAPAPQAIARQRRGTRRLCDRPARRWTRPHRPPAAQVSTGRPSSSAMPVPQLCHLACVTSLEKNSATGCRDLAGP